MKTMNLNHIKQSWAASALVLALALAPLVAMAGQPGKSPLKVFILAGQSNMEGQGQMKIAAKTRNEGKGTLEYLVKDLGVKDLPFVIANSGFAGREQKNPRRLGIINAQAAAAALPEFKDSVTCVETRDFFRTQENSPSRQVYHWNGNAETYFLIGDAMGEAMKKLCK